MLLSNPFSFALMIKDGIWPLFAAAVANDTPGSSVLQAFDRVPGSPETWKIFSGLRPD
jgi:hypothetical protein